MTRSYLAKLLLKRSSVASSQQGEAPELSHELLDELTEGWSSATVTDMTSSQSRKKNPDDTNKTQTQNVRLPKVHRWNERNNQITSF